jgi:hypothetical protein
MARAEHGKKRKEVEKNLNGLVGLSFFITFVATLYE